MGRIMELHTASGIPAVDEGSNPSPCLRDIMFRLETSGNLWELRSVLEEIPALYLLASAKQGPSSDTCLYSVWIVKNPAEAYIN